MDNPFAPVVTTGPIVKQDIDQEIASKATSSSGFIPNLRLIQPAASDQDNPTGSISLGKEENLGNEIEVVIGPWRYHAIRFKNINEVDKEDFNISVDSKYIPAENRWEHPHGLTPGYQEILEKAIPDKQGQISNCAGYDLLFYIPSMNTLASFLIARTALTMPKPSVYDTCRNYRGRKAIFYSQKAPSDKFNWYIPGIRLLEGNGELPQTDLIADQLTKFFDPPGGRYNPEAANSETIR